MEKIIVSVISIIMSNEENGFLIFQGQNFETKKPITVSGYGYNILEDEIIECKGFYKNHSKYGLQFDAKEMKIYTPNTEETILRYLKSGYIKGINKVLAERIFLMFGLESLNILDKNPEELKKISGIGSLTLNKIIKDWEIKRVTSKQSEELIDLGFSFDESMILLNSMGDETLKNILSNPYSILHIEQLSGKFNLVDEIALKKLRYDKNDSVRVLSFLIHSLKENESNGNTFITKSKLMNLSKNKLNISTDVIELVLDVALIKKILKINYKDNEDIIQIFETYKVERDIAENIKRIKNGEKFNISNITAKINNLETKELKLSDDQNNAIVESFTNKINIVNGGPGVGKTKMLDILTKILEKEGLKIVLTALTGRAAQKIYESTGLESKTIHRTLEYKSSINSFEKNEKNKLDADFVILDESSMVDMFLFLKLLKSIKTGTSFIIIGDVDQIPSISAGSVLRDLINSGYINVSRINKLQRQAFNSKIIKNAHLVNAGKTLIYENKSSDDFFFIKTSSDTITIDKIKKIVSSKINNSFSLDPKKDLQLLTSIHDKDLGRINLNNILQNIINPRNKNSIFINKGMTEFRENDNIIQIKNNYENNLMNGDFGLLKEIRNKNLLVSFNNENHLYKRNELDQFELSYAITIHKSQGSEYPLVIIPISHTKTFGMDRSLLYTAMTRGKKIVIIIGSEKELNNIIENDFSRKRNTFLKDCFDNLV